MDIVSTKRQEGIKFKSIKARKSSIAEKGPELKSTFLTGLGDETEKKVMTEIPNSPKPQEQGLKQYILELLEENRKAEKERLAREINKIDSPQKTKERANSIDT